MICVVAMIKSVELQANPVQFQYKRRESGYFSTEFSPQSSYANQVRGKSTVHSRELNIVPRELNMVPRELNIVPRELNIAIAP